MDGRLPTGIWASRIVGRALDILYPPRCVGAGCDRPGTWLCDDCIATIVPVSGDVCVRCGVRAGAPALCQRCRVSPPPYRRATSAGRHDTVLRRGVHALKYGGVRAIAGPLGALAAEAFGVAADGAVVVSVPSRRRRIARRGVDHAQLIAVAVARELETHDQPGVLRRVRATRPQVGLEPAERRANVAGAFAAGSSARGRTFILVDDVLTTGATAEACATALLRAGARRVDVCTVARASLRHDAWRMRPNR